MRPKKAGHLSVQKIKDLILKEFAGKKRTFSMEDVYEHPTSPPDLDLYQALSELIQDGSLIGPDPLVVSWDSHSEMHYKKSSLLSKLKKVASSCEDATLKGKLENFLKAVL